MRQIPTLHSIAILLLLASAQVANADTSVAPAAKVTFPDAVKAVAVAADGRVFAVSNDKLFSVAANDQTPAPVDVGQKSKTAVIAIAPNGKTMAAAGEYDPIVLIDTASQRVSGTLPGYDGNVMGVDSIAWSADGTHLATCSYKSVKIWDVSAKTSVDFKAPGHVGSLTFSKDGKQLMLATSRETNGNTVPLISVCNAATGKTVKDIEIKGQNLSIKWIVPVDEKTALANADSGISVVDLAAGAVKAKWSVAGDPLSMEAAVASPNGKWLAAASHQVHDDPNVTLWNISTGARVAKFSGSDAQVNGVAFSADGKSIIAGLDDKTIIRWAVP